jgi:4-diphosphocytidyl-2-C-methyl-D-erythritol kinase
MQIFAPAKLNLFLEIINRKKNGYHNIETIFHTIGLYDKIIIEPQSDKLTISSSQKSLPTGLDNLALKAAYLLKEKLKSKSGAKIYIEKHIPVGAGLGGGSSDAAAVLLALPILWKRKVSNKELHKIAIKLGADVPFFLNKGTYRASGIGERLKKLKGVKPAWFVIIYPKVGVQTAWAYKNLHFPLTNRQKINKIMQQLVKGASSKVWGRYLFNRLEEPVLKNRPEILNIKNTLKTMGLLNMMSGSGSTVFALVSSRAEGEKVRSGLKKFPWDVFLVRSAS